MLKLIDALLRSVKKDEDIFCIHEDTRSCKRHTLLRLWTTACTAAPPKEEVKSSPCWSIMVTTDSNSSARRLVVPLSLPECSDMIDMDGQFDLWENKSSKQEQMKSGESRAGRPFQIVSLERRSDTHLLICSRRSTFFHLVWNVQWQAVGKERGKSVNIKNTNAKWDTDLRRTLRSWRHTVVNPSSDKHSFGNNFANLKTCEVWKYFRKVSASVNQQETTLHLKEASHILTCDTSLWDAAVCSSSRTTLATASRTRTNCALSLSDAVMSSLWGIKL